MSICHPDIVIYSYHLDIYPSIIYSSIVSPSRRAVGLIAVGHIAVGRFFRGFSRHATVLSATRKKAPPGMMDGKCGKCGGSYPAAAPVPGIPEDGGVVTLILSQIFFQFQNRWWWGGGGSRGPHLEESPHLF